jgi:type IV pilus assembly protein PilX
MNYPQGSVRPTQALRWTSQRGVALWVVMILTLLLGFITLSHTSGVLSRFKSARNERDVTIARQAAEAALRDAEAEVTCQILDQGILKPATFVDQPQLGSHCDSLAPTCQSLMPLQERPGVRLLGKAPINAPAEIDWSVPRGACSGATCGVELGEKTRASPLSQVAQQPKYHIDVLDTDLTGTPGAATPLFRITARGYGATASTVVDLQAVFRPCR